MPRRRQPPHLIWIKPKVDKVTGKLRANGYWAIADGAKKPSTGFGLEHRAEAEIKRLEYEIALHSKKPAEETIKQNGTAPHEVLVVDLIRNYIEEYEDTKIAERTKTKAKLRDYTNTLERLIRFWDGKTIVDINRKTLKAYRTESRPGKPLAESTVLRELTELKIMVNEGIKTGLCKLGGHVLDWKLPAAPQARMEFYSRKEVADLVRAAYRSKGSGYQSTKHLARFILIAVKTGTRSSKIETASYVRTPDRPWMDLDSGIFYRGGVNVKNPRNKRADPVRIPDTLLAHLKRWRAEGSDNVIEYNGDYGSTKKAFYTLKTKIFESERAKQVNRHTFKHTCASWLIAQRVPVDIIASYLSTTVDVILEVYGHYDEEFHKEINDAEKVDRQRRIEKAQAAKLERERAEAKVKQAA